MDLIDSHAHIDFPQFDDDRDAMLDRARAAGVSTLLAIGSGPGPEKLDAALPFAEQHDWIYATAPRSPFRTRETSQSDCLGRDWPRLLLRSFASRDATARLSRPACPR